MPQQTFNSIETGLTLRTKLNANFAELYSLFANNATQTFNFDATTIPSLALWLDAADSTTLFDSTVGGSNVATDGATIARWKDKSISNLDATQSVENSKPILKKSLINGKNCIRMDGINDFLTSNLSLNGLTSFTVYMVCKSSGVSSGISLGYGVAREDGALLQSNAYGSGIVFQMSVVSGAGSISGATAFLKGVYKNSLIIPSFNDIQGTALNSYNQFQNPGFIIQRLPTDIGAVRWANGSIFQNFGGDYCEILVFSSELTPLQRQQIELYLNQKWAIF